MGMPAYTVGDTHCVSFRRIPCRFPIPRRFQTCDSSRNSHLHPFWRLFRCPRLGVRRTNTLSLPNTVSFPDMPHSPVWRTNTVSFPNTLWFPNKLSANSEYQYRVASRYHVISRPTRAQVRRANAWSRTDTLSRPGQVRADLPYPYPVASQPASVAP